MISPTAAQVVAADRMAEARRHSSAARQAAVARCCPPATWNRAVRRATGAVVRVRDRFRRHRSAAAPCCA